jgi:uncharacterized membrane protein
MACWVSYDFLAHPLDVFALCVFAACWGAYQPMLDWLAPRRPVVNRAMEAMRLAWMKRAMARENRIMDTNLLGHMLGSASFFASTNLLLIAAVAGLLVGGSGMLENLRGVEVGQSAPVWLLQAKIGLVAFALSKGLLDFIWCIRQMNYSLALFGAAPEWKSAVDLDAYAAAVAGVLNPSFVAFNKGVRAYYFALAAAAWVVSPWLMAVGSLAATALLLHRQVASPAAAGVAAARGLVD